MARSRRRQTADASQQPDAGPSSHSEEDDAVTNERPDPKRYRQALHRCTPGAGSTEGIEEEFLEDGEDQSHIRDITPAAAARSRATTPEFVERYDNQDAPEDQPLQPPAAPFQQQRRRPANIPTAPTDAIPPINRTGVRSGHGMDASLAQMMLASSARMLEELQAQTGVLLEIRDDQKELLLLEKKRAEAATAVAEEPPTLDAHEVAECIEVALKVFKEDPMAERSTILRHLVAFHAYPNPFEMEKVKGAKKVKLMKSKVSDRLKNLRFSTAAATRFAMKERHKDVLTDKAVVKDRAKANALKSKYETIVPPKAVPMPVMELARDVYKNQRAIGPTGTIQGLTKAQVAFMWAVALWTLHPDGSESLPLGPDDNYEEIKTKVAGILDPLPDNKLRLQQVELRLQHFSSMFVHNEQLGSRSKEQICAPWTIASPWRCDLSVVLSMDALGMR